MQVNKLALNRECGPSPNQTAQKKRRNEEVDVSVDIMTSVEPRREARHAVHTSPFESCSTTLYIEHGLKFKGWGGEVSPIFFIKGRYFTTTLIPFEQEAASSCPLTQSPHTKLISVFHLRHSAQSNRSQR